MKPLLFLLLPLLLFPSATPAAAAPEREPSLAELTDSLECAIRQHDRYVARREARIARLKQEGKEVADESLFRLYSQIYEEYKAYICDSAIHYLHLNLRWTIEHQRPDAATQTRIELARLMAAAGMYQEATQLLQQTDRPTLPDRLLPAYYDSYHKLYEESARYTTDADFRQQYRQQAAAYADSLLRVLDPASSLYLEQAEMREAQAGRLENAFALNDSRLRRAAPDTPEYALATFHRSQLYHRLGNREEEKRYLTLSALADIRQAITDHASLWTLAWMLYEEGETERAYRYIRFSWEETKRYNARSRSLQTADMLSLIDLTYQALLERQASRLRLSVGLIAALALLLVAAAAFSYRQMKRLAVAHDRLEQANGQLQSSNRIKEEYIGRFMNLCSSYLGRLDAYRRMVNKKITSGQTEELLRTVRSREAADEDTRELYQHFDTAFLTLFPDFIEQFNALLLPEARLVPRKGELLNTELRIFALIRLGIDDSSQIADFLRYSVNTIYNYRAKVKNGAAGDRETFEKRLMSIS